MLELKNVSKTYRGIPAVWDVSFALKEGEVLGYLGPNGSGKSTTVKMIIGMIQPTKGKVLFAGRNIHNDLATLPRPAWLCPGRGPRLYPSFRARVSAADRPPARHGGAAARAESPHTAAAALAGGGTILRPLRLLQRNEAARPHRRRPATRSQLIVLDEPLSGLDAVSARLFKDLLSCSPREGKAILYISHVLEVVERVCDRVIVLAQVVFSPTPRRVN